MKTFGRRTLSIILSVMMVLSCFAGIAFSVGAETSGDYEYEVLEDGTVSLTEYNGTDTDVIIPSEIDGRNVTKIDSYLFYYNRELISVTIPDSVTEIGYGVFEGCESLKNISVDEENTVYKSVDGVLFNKDMTLLMSYPGDREAEYSIPDGVTTIDYYAFNRCAKITSVVIPDSVTKIDIGAFDGCTMLENISIPSSVIDIDDSSFDRCSGLNSINVDENNEVYKSVDGVLFDKNMTEIISYPGGKIGDYSIPDGVTKIGGAFDDCSGLTGIIIPDSITEIGEFAFFGCYRLEKVLIPDSVTVIGDSAFAWCTSLTSIIIPELVTNIGVDTFECCSGLTEITIPSRVTEIGDGAFSRCHGLNSINVDENNLVYKSVDGVLFNKDMTEIIVYPGGREGGYVIPDSVAKICGSAFSGCFGLTDIKIPDSVKEVGDDAFYDCYKLTSVKIPDGVAEIGYMTFGECEGLTITIPASVTTIDSGAFLNCTTLYIYGYSDTEAERFANENGYTFISLGSCSHSDTELVNVKEAACTEKGYTGDKVCVNCKTVLEKGVELPALGHSFENYVSDNNATCTADGTKTAKCERCDVTDTITDVGTAKGHTVVEDEAIEPSCTETGLTAGSHCSECGATVEKQKTIPALGHDDGDKDGICDICGEAVTADTYCDETGHVDSNKDGICDNCGDVMPEVKNCKCICHKSGIAKIFYKLFRFFWRIFGMNKTCDCGVAHY